MPKTETSVEARSVFYEESALLFDDPDHSEEEQRYLLVGPGRDCVVHERRLAMDWR